MEKYYGIDLMSFPVSKLQRYIKERELLPSHRILKENTDKWFAVLSDKGIKNLAELTNALKTKKRAENFSQQSGIPAEYITILRRYVNSFASKPEKLESFSWIDKDFIEKLLAGNIKTTADYFSTYANEKDRKSLAADLNLRPETTEELFSLCDLVRIPYVSPLFARIFYTAGIKKTKEMIQTDPEKLQSLVNNAIKKHKFAKVTISLKDIRYCQDFAKELNCFCE